MAEQQKLLPWWVRAGEVVVLPRRVAETLAGIQALLSGHIPAFPEGTVLLPMAADGSLPVEAQSLRSTRTPINTRMALKTCEVLDQQLPGYEQEGQEKQGS